MLMRPLMLQCMVNTDKATTVTTVCCKKLFAICSREVHEGSRRACEPLQVQTVVKIN